MTELKLEELEKTSGGGASIFAGVAILCGLAVTFAVSVFYGFVHPNRC